MDYRKKKKNKTYNKKKSVETVENTEKTQNIIRLNKFLSNAGICARREADKLIADGKIKVNGKVITELGAKILKTDTVIYNNKKVRSEKFIYILMNKPKNVITTSKDESGRKTVLDIIGDRVKERIYPVGRLDKDTTGVLIFTNDGKLTDQLTHPSYNKKKIYHVVLDKAISEEDIKKLHTGQELEDGFMKFDEIKHSEGGSKKEVGVEIHSGRKRIIRRMFQHIGYTVVKLDRVYFAGLTKLKVPRGRWRFLEQKEINMLKMRSYK